MSKSIHRLAAISLLIGALAAAYWLVNEFWLGQYRDNQNTISQLQERVQRYRAIAATRPVLQQQLQQTQQNSAVEGYYLTQASATLAATDLQQQVKGLIERNGGRLASTQILPVVSEGAFSRVAIRVQMTVTDIETLQKNPACARIGPTPVIR